MKTYQAQPGSTYTQEKIHSPKHFYQKEKTRISKLGIQDKKKKEAPKINQRKKGKKNIIKTKMNKLENENAGINKYIQELIPTQNCLKSRYFNEGDGVEKWRQDSKSIQAKTVVFKNINIQNFPTTKTSESKGKRAGRRGLPYT